MGLCPECLIKSGFPTGTGPGVTGEEAGARFVPPPVEEVAQLFPQLEILGLIGKGGMGAVYRARQPTLDRLVALKVLPPAVASDPGFAERFNREARALARLNHPNIVAVHDFGKAGDLHYLLMEFVDGHNLREVEHAGRLSPEQALAIVPQICEALQFAHNEGIVHRDIKPENLLLDPKGRVKITDFGIAKIVGAPAGKVSLTGAKDVVGTPHYMAPEQIEKPQTVDHRADIYSLGVVFYEMLTGELPLGKFQPPSIKAPVDVRLDKIVLHSLEKEPERRYQQASQVKSDVENIAGTPPPLKPPPVSLAAPAPGAPHPPAAVARPVTHGNATVTIPAVGLIVAGTLNLLSPLTAVVVLGSLRSWLGNLLGHAPPIFPFHNPLFGWSIGVFKAIPALLIIYGGVQMVQLRSYAWSIAAGILGIISCSLVGLVMGIWSLIVLTRADVREAFGYPTAPQTPRPGNWQWLWPVAGVIALVLVLGLLLAGILAGVRLIGHWRSVSGIGVAGSYVALQDTIESNWPATAAVQAEATDADLRTADSDPRTVANAPAVAQRIQRTVKGGSEANLTRTFAVDREGKLSMDVDRGGIHVVGADQDTVEVRVKRQVRRANQSEADRILAEQELVLEQSGNEISINSKDPPSLSGSSGWGFMKPELDVNYEVTVPRKFDVHLKTAGGGINVAAIQGPVYVRTEGGGLEFKDVEGNVDGQTQGGGIQATGCKGSLVIKTEGGGITVLSFAGPSVQGTTEGGGITADFAVSPRSDCLLHTEGGSVTARLPATAQVTLAARTEGGRVKSELPVQTEGKTEGNQLRGKINGGGPLLKLETKGGSIRVEKR